MDSVSADKLEASCVPGLDAGFCLIKCLFFWSVFYNIYNASLVLCMYNLCIIYLHIHIDTNIYIGKVCLTFNFF